MGDLAQTFAEIHRRNTWGDPESRSGGGSTLAFTESLRSFLPFVLQRYAIRSMLDAGCGDWNWMSQVDLGVVHYVGCDIVPALVAENALRYSRPDRRFISADITDPRALLPRVDLVLCRATLFHLSFVRIRAALRNFRRAGIRYLLATTHPHVDVNEDIPDGAWRRLNLCRPPIGLPEPEYSFQDGPGDDGYLALWRLR